MSTSRRHRSQALACLPARPGTGPHGRPSATSTALLLCLAASSPFALATGRELDAHEHGAATLDIALDGARLHLDLDSPADNVLGFEHAPSTDTQRASVAEAERVLGADGVFVPDAAAGCTLEEVTVDIALADREDGQDEEHADGHEDEIAAADDHGHARATHSDVTVGHVFLCENPDALGTIATTLFERFDGFVDIDVQLVGPGGQDGGRLTADEPALSLEPIL